MRSENIHGYLLWKMKLSWLRIRSRFAISMLCSLVGAEETLKMRHIALGMMVKWDCTVAYSNFMLSESNVIHI